MGRLYGCEWFMDQNMVVMDRGDITNATNVYGAGQSGTTVNIDNASGTATGTIVQGARFTIDGNAQEYVVTSDVTAASGYFAVPISPALAATPSDDAAITWISACKGNVMYTRNAIAAAIVPPAPLAIGSDIAFYNNVGIRVTQSSSTTSLSDSMVFDTYLAARVIQVKGGIVLNG